MGLGAQPLLFPCTRRVGKCTLFYTVFLSLVHIASSQIGSCAMGREDFYTLTTQTICVYCPTGKYKPAYGAYSCYLCEAGKYQDLTGQTVCSACAGGKYQPLTGKTECSACAIGTYQDLTGKTVCSACAIGTYQVLTGKTVCTTCFNTALTTTVSTGSIDFSQCVCKQGYTWGIASIEIRNTACSAHIIDPNFQFYTYDSLKYSVYKRTINGVDEFLSYYRDIDRQYSSWTVWKVGDPDPYLYVYSSNTDPRSITNTWIQNCQGVWGNSAAVLTGTMYCISCPQSTYKSTIGKEVCTYCPENSSHALLTRTDATDCLCNPGYTGPNGGPCSACGASKYKNISGSAPCSNCLANASHALIAQKSSTVCSCNAGYTPDNLDILFSNPACAEQGHMPGKFYFIGLDSNQFPMYQRSVNGLTYVFMYEHSWGAWIIQIPGEIQILSNVNPTNNPFLTVEPWIQYCGGVSSEASVILEKDTKVCQACPVSTYQTGVGSSTCSACPAGTLSPEGSDALEDCVVPECAAGSTGPDFRTCTACTAGKYKLATGSAACTDCGAGTYSDAVGATLASTCSACPANSISPSGSSLATSCKCNAGYTGSDGESCSACFAGTYKTGVGSATCLNCDANTYSTTVGATAVSTCLACTSNSQSVSGSTAATSCVCNPGFTGPNGGVCAACPAGAYKPDVGAAACSACPVNSLSPEVSTAISACLCNAGYETSLDGSGVIVACSACPTGKYKATAGSASGCSMCESDLSFSTGAFDSASPYCVCRPGYVLDAGACRACQKGMYKENQGNSTLGCASLLDGCCPCGQFQTTASAGSSVALTDCVCLHGHGVADPNNFACMPCPRGTYKEGTDRQACAACPAGTSTSEVGAFEARECVSRAGYFMVFGSGGLGTAYACANGTYSDYMNATACEPCFAGATSPPASESIDACVCRHPYMASGEAHDCTCGAGFALA